MSYEPAHRCYVTEVKLANVCMHSTEAYTHTMYIYAHSLMC